MSEIVMPYCKDKSATRGPVRSISGQGRSNPSNTTATSRSEPACAVPRAYEPYSTRVYKRSPYNPRSFSLSSASRARTVAPAGLSLALRGSFCIVSLFLVLRPRSSRNKSPSPLKGEGKVSRRIGPEKLNEFGGHNARRHSSRPRRHRQVRAACARRSGRAP